MRANPNSTTVQVYNIILDQYLQNTPSTYNKSHAPLLKWISKSLSLIPPSGKVLEIGSGPGRDAQYIKSKGFEVLCSDASSTFVDYLNSQGHCAKLINVLTDNLPRGYDMIFANAVVPHFTPSDLDCFLRKAYNSLLHRGIVTISTKQGQGDAWVNEKSQEKRYVYYWPPQQFMSRIESNGFKVVYAQQDIPGDLPAHTWILVIAQKS